ncbi:MAG TPA: sugar metabolism transcriptional regulator [Sedimenticola sp.]|nr:sugar metabolism transcriptional regulator [Sedimenticola sp.]
MILAEIRDYLKARGRASLADIALHFDTPPDAVRGMLEQWIRKGRVRRSLASAACGNSCTQCDPAATEIYEWSGEGARNTGDIPVHCESGKR